MANSANGIGLLIRIAVPLFICALLTVVAFYGAHRSEPARYALVVDTTSFAERMIVGLQLSPVHESGANWELASSAGGGERTVSSLLATGRDGSQIFKIDAFYIDHNTIQIDIKSSIRGKLITDARCVADSLESLCDDADNAKIWMPIEPKNQSYYLRVRDVD